MGQNITKMTHLLRLALLWGLLLFTGSALKSQITVSATSTNTTCYGMNNGYASAFATGGWAPYTYLWSNGATTPNLAALAPGVYTVTVTDIDQAFGTASVTVTSPPQLGVTTYSQSQICDVQPDGTATAVPFGGTPPYTYHWSNGGTLAEITGLLSGTYTVTVTDANNCTAVSSVNVWVFQNEGLWIGDMIVNVTCFGANNGMATAMPMSGTPPYSYQWSNGGNTMKITGLAPGNYTVTVTDANGCLGTHLFTITQPDQLNIVTTTTAAACVNNGTASATIFGGTSPYSILWSNGQTTQTISNLAPGTYSVTVTDANGCTRTANTTVGGSGAGINVIATLQVAAGCNTGGSAYATVSNGSGNYTYLWDNGQMTAIATNLSVGVHSVTVIDQSTSCSGTGTVNVPQASSLLAAITITTNATCSTGGSASVSVSGGIAPYTYVWSNGQTGPTATNLMAGNYNVTVTDATGCIIIKSVTIAPPQGPSVTTQVNTQATCTSGGSATATATGGLPPYIYLWSNGATTPTATNLLAGVRTVTVTDANGCASTSSVTITQAQGPSATVQLTTQATCLTGGSATVSVSGGTTPYTYLWSNGATTATATNLAPGVRTVTVTDANGCSTTGSVTITQTPSPAVTATASTVVSCTSGGSATAVASGGLPPYAYLWSNAANTATISNVAPGTYTVTATDANGCTASATVTISAPVGPSVVISASTIANCNQPGSATALAAGGGGGPYTYHWSNGENTATAVNLTGGTYTVTVTAANGCTATTSVSVGLTNNGISVGGFVWYDNGQDGFQSPYEMANNGIANITVKIIKAGPDGFFNTLDDITVAITTTDALGNYVFNCITPGTYIVMFSGIPTGHEYTNQDAVNNDCLDSDANAAGMTNPFTVVAGQGDNLCVDAGIHIICQNIVNPGAICCNQTICEGQTPALLTEALAPIGGSGALEYLWMEYIQIGSSPAQWYPIAGATAISYQPGPLTKTTFFMRCVRRAGCENYSESNIVTITVLPAGSNGCIGGPADLVLKPIGPTSVEVNWTAPAEQEQYAYTVQHSVNTLDWTDIKTVMGQHNAFGANEYSYLDETPLSGINFYRIMRTSVTGVQAYSAMKSIEIALNGLNAVSIYPNPVHNTLYVKNIAKYDADVTVDITTAGGDLVRSIVLAKGTVELKNLDMENLPSGLYFARIQFDSGDVKTIKLTKL